MTQLSLKTGILLAAGAAFLLMLTTFGSAQSLSYAPEEIPLPEIDESHESFVRQAVTFQAPAPAASSAPASSAPASSAASSPAASTSSSSAAVLSEENRDDDRDGDDDRRRGFVDWLRRTGGRDRDGDRRDGERDDD